MCDGKIIEQGETFQILHSPKNTYTCLLYTSDIAHIYTLMSMQQKERIDPEALTSLIMDLKATIKSMKDMLSHKKVVVSHPKLDYNQVYDDVYVNGKMIRSADCLYRMYDCVQTHLLN